jgi:hypothetical protein
MVYYLGILGMVGLVSRYGIYWFLGRVRSTLVLGSTHDMVIIVLVFYLIVYV